HTTKGKENKTVSNQQNNQKAFFLHLVIIFFPNKNHPKKKQNNSPLLQHAIRPCGQPSEETQSTGRQLAPEPWRPKHIQPPQSHHDSDRHGVETNSSNQAKDHEQETRPWVSPAYQRLKTFTLRSHISNHSLNPSRHAPQPIIPHSNNIRTAACWERIEFLIQFVGINTLSMRQPGVHVGRVPWPGAVPPESNKGHVKQHSGDNELGKRHQ
ncbi:hypothetical protein TorRG33x02_301890, partial [Trema orientale]